MVATEPCDHPSDLVSDKDTSQAAILSALGRVGLALIECEGKRAAMAEAWPG